MDESFLEFLDQHKILMTTHEISSLPLMMFSKVDWGYGGGGERRVNGWANISNLPLCAKEVLKEKPRKRQFI